MALAMLFASSLVMGIYDAYIANPLAKGAGCEDGIEYVIDLVSNWEKISIGIYSCLHVRPALLLWEMKNATASKDVAKQHDLLEHFYDTSTGTAVFESIVQVGIALIFLMENLVVTEDSESTDGLSTKDQAVVVMSAFLSVASIANGVYRYDRKASVAQSQSLEDDADKEQFTTFDGLAISRQWYHQVMTVVHRFAEVLAVGCSTVVLITVASESGKGSGAFYAFAVSTVGEFLVVNVTLLYTRCKQEGTGSALAYVSTGLATPMLMFVNPIDKNGKPFAPWLRFYGYRGMSLVVRWAISMAYIHGNSVCFSTGAGIAIFATALTTAIVLFGTTWFIWKTRNLQELSPFWVGAIDEEDFWLGAIDEEEVADPDRATANQTPPAIQPGLRMDANLSEGGTDGYLNVAATAATTTAAANTAFKSPARRTKREDANERCPSCASKMAFCICNDAETRRRTTTMGSKCEYVSEQRRTCSKSAVNTKPYCSAHTCSVEGCASSKSSRAEFCTVHEEAQV